jgi:hypothetical protein
MLNLESFQEFSMKTQKQCEPYKDGGFMFCSYFLILLGSVMAFGGEYWSWVVYMDFIIS